MLSFSYLNVGSIKNKATSLYDYVISNNVDVMALTETWLYSEEEENGVHINELLPNGYLFKHIPRQDGRVGGGVGLLHHKGIKVALRRPRRSFCDGITQFEFLDCDIRLTNDPRSKILLIIVYRPPPTPINKLKVKSFWKEWKKLLTALAKDHRTFLIVGDLNFHLDVADDAYAEKFTGILEELNLVQLVTGPTHTAGHTLDVVITHPENQFISQGSLTVHDPGITNITGATTKSHHFAISFSLNFCKPKPVYRKITYRNINNLDNEAFLNDLQRYNLEGQLLESSDLDEMVEHFVNTTVFSHKLLYCIYFALYWINTVLYMVNTILYCFTTI